MESKNISRVIKFMTSGKITDSARVIFYRWLTDPTDQQQKRDELKNIWSTTSRYPDGKESEGLTKLHSEANIPYNTYNKSTDGNATTLRLLLRVVSSVAAAIILFGGGFLFSHLNNQDLRNFTLITADGSKGQFILPDSTIVWLNSDSRLSYSEDYGKSVRCVKLDGEGRFEVVRDIECPFIVEMESIDVEVLGTIFNATNYKDQDIEEVVLISGSVNIFNEQCNTNTILSPNERYTYHKNQRRSSIESVRTKNYATWFKPSLAFNDEILGDILFQLERLYNIEIETTDGVNLTTRMSFKLNGEPLECALRILTNLNDIECQVESPEKIVISPNLIKTL